MNTPSAPLTPPPRRLLLGEARLFTTLPRTVTALVRAGRSRAPDAPRRPVMVLPGFGTGDLATWPLRRFLQHQGFAVEGWGLGVNRAGLDRPHRLSDISEGWGALVKEPYRGEGGVPLMADLATARVRQRVQQLGEPLALVGWSLGGTIAREVARDLPQEVSRVVTLGSPVIGGPKYTAAAARLAARGLDLDWIEEQVRLRERRTAITQPVTNIFSRSDAIVSWPAAMDHFNPRVTTIEVDEAHLALGFSPAVWQLVLAALRADEVAA